MSAINEGIPLSGSNSSLPILINTISSPGVLIHTADTADHYVNIWATNTSSSVETLTILKGTLGNYVVDCVIKVPPQTIKIPVEPGILLTNSYQYRAYASNSTCVILSGFVLKRSGE